MPNLHAMLSASSSHRWLECPPSAKLNAGVKDNTSTYAEQGTEAHSLCEYKVLKALGRKALDPTERLTYFDEEMAECTDMYAQYVAEQVEKAKTRCNDPVVLVEQKLDFSSYVPDGFGTGDCVIVSDDVLSVVDFKYGVGVLVEAENNPQMMCYALGALNLFDGIYDIEKISMTIFQPRREHISTFEMKKEQLLDWAENILAPTAQLAAKGEGDFKAGEHCRFCKVKATCRKRMEYNMELAKYDFEMPDTLEDEEIEVILSKVDELVSWSADVKEYALQQALQGKHWKEWKVVEGRSNRKYTDEEKVAETVTRAGHNPYEQKLLGITAMTSLLGKAKFNELLGDLVYKPQGKPTLVPESDKRPEMNTSKDDFSEN